MLYIIYNWWQKISWKHLNDHFINFFTNILFRIFLLLTMTNLHTCWYLYTKCQYYHIMHISLFIFLFYFFQRFLFCLNFIYYDKIKKYIRGFCFIRCTRRVWRYQKEVIRIHKSKKDKQQWPKEKGQKDKQRSTKHTYTTKGRVTRTPLKALIETGCWRHYSARI